MWSMENVKLTLDGAEEDTLNCVRGWVILFTKGRLSVRDEVAGSGPPLNLFLAVLKVRFHVYRKILISFFLHLISAKYPTAL